MKNLKSITIINDKIITEAEVKSSLTIEQYFKIKDKFYNVSSDLGFKYVLSEPCCLSGILTLLLGKKIKPEMLHYCNIENINDNKSSIRTDLLVYVDLDDKLIRIFINLEMQNKYNHDLNKRMFNYLSSVLQKNISIDKELVYQSYWIMPGSETKHYDFGNSFIYDVAFRHKDTEFLPHKINIVDLNRMAKCGNIVLEELAVLFFAKNKDKIDEIKTELALKWRKVLWNLIMIF